MFRHCVLLSAVALLGCDSTSPEAAASSTLSAVTEVHDTILNTRSGCRFWMLLPMDSIPRETWTTNGLATFERYQQSTSHAEITAQRVTRNLSIVAIYTGPYQVTLTLGTTPAFTLNGGLVISPGAGPGIRGTWACDSLFPAAVDSALAAVGYRADSIPPGNWTLSENLPVE